MSYRGRNLFKNIWGTWVKNQLLLNFRQNFMIPIKCENVNDQIFKNISKRFNNIRHKTISISIRQLSLLSRSQLHVTQCHLWVSLLSSFSDSYVTLRGCVHDTNYFWRTQLIIKRRLHKNNSKKSFEAKKKDVKQTWLKCVEESW